MAKYKMFDVKNWFKPMKKNINDFESNINKKIYGTDSPNLGDMDDLIKNFNIRYNDLLDSYNNRGDMSLSFLMDRIKKSSEIKDNPELKHALEKFGSAIENNDRGFMSSILNGDESDFHRYIDFEQLMEFIPDLRLSFNDLKSSIKSSNNFNIMSNNNIKYSDTVDKIDDVQRIIKNIQEKHNFSKIEDDVISTFLIRGKVYVFSKPYEVIFSELLQRKKEAKDDFNSAVNESMFIDSETPSQIITESLSNNDNLKNKDIGMKVDGMTEKFDLYEPNTTYSMINEVSTLSKLKRMKRAKSSTICNDGVVDVGKKDEKIGVKDAYVEVIQPNRIKKLSIQNVPIGYIYVESADVHDRLKNDSLMSGARNKVNNIHDDKLDKDKMIKEIAREIHNVIDKKFIVDNAELSKELYEIIKYHEDSNKKLKISFLEPEYVTELELNDGKGIYYYTITLCRLYVALLMTYMMFKMTRSFDQLNYGIRTGSIDKNNKNSKANDVLRQLYSREFSFKEFITSNIGRIFNLGASGYNKMITHHNEDNTKPYTVEVIAGQDTNIKDNLLSDILEMIKRSLPNPSPVLDSYNDVDYSRTIVNSNIQYGIIIIEIQRVLNEGLTKVYRKIVSANIPDDSSITANSFEYALKPPMQLMNTILVNSMRDNFENSESIAIMMMGEEKDTPKDKYVRERFKRQVLFEAMPDLPIDKWQQCIDKLYLEYAESEEQDNEESTGNTNNSFF